LSICHPLGVAGFAAATDNPYFVMAGFAAITDYFCCRCRLQLRESWHRRLPGLRHIISSLASITLPPINSSSLGYNFESAMNNTASLHICSVPLASPPPQIFLTLPQLALPPLSKKLWRKHVV
jgi:hypothetical protein